MILQTISQLFAAAYGISAELAGWERFLIDGETLAGLGREFPGLISRHPTETVLIAESNGVVELALYIDPEVVERLERLGARFELNEETFADFAVATEGMSHLALALWKIRHGLPMNPLEMEVQGEIDKFLVVALMLRWQGRYSPQSAWRRLFTGCAFSPDLSGAEAERYRVAHAWTAPYCAILQRCFVNPVRVERLLYELNRFYRLNLWRKFDTLRRCRS